MVGNQGVGEYLFVEMDSYAIALYIWFFWDWGMELLDGAYS